MPCRDFRLISSSDSSLEQNSSTVLNVNKNYAAKNYNFVSTGIKAQTEQTKANINTPQFVYVRSNSLDNDTGLHSLSLPSSPSASSTFGSSLTTATDPLIAQHVDHNGTLFFAASSDQSDNYCQIYDETPRSSVLTLDFPSQTSTNYTHSPPLSLNATSHSRLAFALFREFKFLHTLGRRLCLSCNVRRDEGSFIFKHQALNKMIVLTRSEAHGEEGIRISQHQDGRIFRESRIPSYMENWMVKSLLRGLCEDFFSEINLQRIS